MNDVHQAVHRWSEATVGKSKSGPYTCLDLFSGCGGFTLGMHRAGFDCLAAIDFNEQAVNAMRSNLGFVRHVLSKDMSTYSPEELAELIGVHQVDVIVGGPPCQGFSTARQVDGANHGKRLKDDPRRTLFRDFLRFVDYFRPKVFVIENVPGMSSAAGGKYFTALQHEARALGTQRGLPGYRVHSQVENSWQLGAPQKRKRRLVIGVRRDIDNFFPPEIEPAPRAIPGIVLGPAIGDLPIIRAGGGDARRQYDDNARAKHIKKYGQSATKFLKDVVEVELASELTNHKARPHNARDLRDFKKLREGESSAVAMRRGVKFEFPYDKENFKDKFTKQSRSKPCSTIVAHLSKDGLMFVHPTQKRSLSPREAARVQTFPDWYRFPDEPTHSFRLIGNAVPPIVSEAVGLATIDFLKKALASAPKGPSLTEAEIIKALRQTPAQLRRMEARNFLVLWHSLLSYFPELHPANSSDHGSETERVLRGSGELASVCSERYLRSGWPVALVGIGKEAARRVKSEMLEPLELYTIVAN